MGFGSCSLVLGSQVWGQLTFSCGCCVWVLFLMAVAVFFEEKTHKGWSVMQRVTYVMAFTRVQPPSQCRFQVTGPTGFDDFVHHPNQLNLTELFNKAWQVRCLVKHLILFEIDSIVENPYYWKSSGVHDPKAVPLSHFFGYEADRADLLFLAKGLQRILRIFCLSLSWSDTSTVLCSWIHPIAMWYGFLGDFLRIIRVLRALLEWTVLALHFIKKANTGLC